MRDPLPYDDLQRLAAADPRRRAVVIGASLAGLLAARVLADHCDEVVLLDRDVLPFDDRHRKATPQSRHAHGLLARGREAIEMLLPGITDEWVAAGARLGDLQQDVAFFGGRHAFMRESSGIVGVAGSRVLLEGAVRRRVLGLAGVRSVTGVDVRGIVLDERRRVAGVTVADIVDDAPPLVLPAALVVDASGRGSRLPAWLRQHGYAAAEEERIEVDLRYATCHFRRTPRHARGLEVVLCTTTSDTTRPGVMLAQEGGRWVVTLGGYGDDAPPLALDAFVQRAQAMASPELAAVVADAESLHDPMPYRFPHSQRRRYERLARWPDGLLAIGDAICSFNPIYGQGMTVAACEALALADVLRAGGRRVGQRYFCRAARIVDTPWTMAAGGDLAIPAVPGPRPLPVRLVNRWIARVFAAASVDAGVARQFLRVAHLLDEPSALFAPAFVWRVLRTPPRTAGDAGAPPQSARWRASGGFFAK